MLVACSISAGLITQAAQHLHSGSLSAEIYAIITIIMMMMTIIIIIIIIIGGHNLLGATICKAQIVFP